MKKLLVALALVVTTCVGADAGVKDKLLLYLPNRIVDLTDIFSASIGVGPAVRAEVRFTRAFSFGAGVGATAKAVKAYNRQYGGCLDNGWEWTFTCLGAEDWDRAETSRWVQQYWHQYFGIPSPSDSIYEFYEGQRDYWEIGMDGGCFLIGHVALHPVEIADFVAGWFFIDFKGDDLTSEDFE